jgi:hypothetical protein
MTSTLYPVSETGMKAWVTGVAAYASQMKMLFVTNDNIQPVMSGYWEREKGIRLWKPQ